MKRRRHTPERIIGKRLKELEHENSSLKAIIADQALEVRGLKETSKEIW